MGYAEGEQAATTLRRALGMVRLTRRFTMLATLYLFVYGVVVLLFRALTRCPRNLLAFGFLALFPVAAVALALERRKFPARTAVKALLDSMHRCGGLLVAGDERDAGAWDARLPEFRVPTVHWHARRHVLALTASAIFVVFAFSIPRRYTRPQSSYTLEVDHLVEELTEQVDLLEEEAVLEDTRARALRDELDRLAEEARGDDPARTLEALDHIQAVMNERASEAAEAALAQVEEMTKAQALADASATLAATGRDPALMAAAMKALAGLLKDQELERMLAGALPEGLLGAAQAGALTPEQLKALSELLKQCKGECRGCLGRLCKARLIDAKFLKLCKNAGRYDPDALAAFLADGQAGKELAVLLRACCGKGGVDRGRGDAPMTWTEGSSEQGAAFKEQVLPPGPVSGLNNTKLVGISAAVPKVSAGATPVRSGVLATGEGPGAAHTRTVLPRHRAAVRRYFERTDKEGTRSDE